MRKLGRDKGGGRVGEKHRVNKDLVLKLSGEAKSIIIKINHKESKLTIKISYHNG